MSQQPFIVQDASKIVHFFPRGSTGIEIFSGYYSEEYLSILTGPEAADIFDKMRRSDDQIKMLYRSVTNPILSANWDIEAVDDSPEETKIKDYLKFVLFEDMGNPVTGKYKTWGDFLNEALSCIHFGHAVFEITNKIGLGHPEFGDYLGIKDLGWRSPKTIQEWHLNYDGSINNIRQWVNGDLDRDVNIAGKYLIVISVNKEGDNYEGISDLRPIYGNWLRKDVLRKLQMIGIERAATGVPVVWNQGGGGETNTGVTIAQILQAFTMHQKAYMEFPGSKEQYELDFLKLPHDAEKVQAAIEAENIGMTKSFVANFMELGLNGSGSFALGSDLSDIFLSGLQLYARLITEPMNRKVIKNLVDGTFGKRAKYPKLVVNNINDKAGKEFADILGILKTSGLLQVTDRLKTFIHKRFGYPDFLEGAEEVVTPEPVVLSEQDFNFAEPKRIDSIIKASGNELHDLMQTALTVRANRYIEDIIKIMKNSGSKVRDEVKKLPVPGKREYKKELESIAANIVARTTNGTLKELGLPQDYRFGEIDGLGKSVPSNTKKQSKTAVDLTVETQDADLRKSLTFQFNQNADNVSLEQMSAQLKDTADDYIAGPSVRSAAANFTSNAINQTRNGVFQTPEVFETIESFIFTNPSPKAAICVNLAGRVFTRSEYLTSTNLPPLHHGCNSFIVAQTTKKKTNKAVDTIGLNYTGTPLQVEEIIKSKKF